MKITYQGRRINGRFDGSWFKKAVNVTFVVALFMTMGVMIGAIAFSNSTVSAHNYPVAVDTTPEKIAAFKHDLLVRLSHCENPAQNAGLIVYDNNAKGTLTGQNVPSIGLLMFKIGTVKEGYALSHTDKLTDAQAIELAINSEKAFAIAEEIIFSGKDKKGIGHWAQCSEGLNLAAEVAIIKKFEAK